MFEPAGRPLFQRVGIDLENEDQIEKINEAEEIPGAAAEERAARANAEREPCL